jgi:cellulose synthase/poly-beta-1,6-N-acetylglucosamine synthase-like glycosyltransferase
VGLRPAKLYWRFLMSNAPRDVGPNTDSRRILSVVIPAYNEEKTILRVVREVLQVLISSK